MIWGVLKFYQVHELQAYVFPFSLALIAIGWNEGRRGERTRYQGATTLGLSVLMGSAFFQSLNSVSYALLLFAESLAAFVWGVRTRSRGYVQLAVLSLVANAVAQFGPGFVALERWIQIAAIGSILLGGGLAALFRRERILAARQTLAGEWKSWNP